MDRPCLGEVYDGIDFMIEDIRNIINEKEEDPDEKFFKELQVIMVERWNKMTTPLHLLAFALSPRFYSQSVLGESTTRVALYRDPKVAQRYKAALRRLFPEHLQPTVAISLSSERNWSTYSFIHSIKRNRLNTKKADNLVFVHSNLRLTTHKDNTYKKGEAQHWDVEPKSTELEAHFDALAIDDGDRKLLSDVEADPEVASTDASGTVCASNLQQHSDDELFDDFL